MPTLLWIYIFDGSGIFLNDNARIHLTPVVQDWLRDHEGSLRNAA